MRSEELDLPLVGARNLHTFIAIASLSWACLLGYFSDLVSLSKLTCMRVTQTNMVASLPHSNVQVNTKSV